MALLWGEDFQHLRSNAMYARAYFDVSTGNWNATGGRNNGPNLAAQVVAYPKKPAPSGNTFICGTRQVFTALNATNLIAGCGVGLGIAINTGPTNTALGLYVTTAGALQLRRGTSAGTLLANTANGTITIGPAYHFALKFILDGSAGSTIVYLDGAELADLTFAGNTSAVNSWDAFASGSSSSSQCDLYVFDGTNPTGNDPCEPIPDVRCDWRLADGAGYSSGFTPSAGSNYQNVDENNPDDDTTYNSTTAAAIDAYTVENMPLAGGQIVGVIPCGHARKTDAGVASHKVGVRLGSTNYMGTAGALQVTYTDRREHHGVDPSTNAVWVEADFNAIQVVNERP